MWQTDAAWSPLLCLHVLDKEDKKKKPNNLRLFLEERSQYACVNAEFQECCLML